MPSACDIIDDIEDLLASQDIDPRGENRKSVTIRVRKTRKKVHIEEHDGNIAEEIEEYVAPKSIIPGTQTIFIKTWGCTHNSSDSEYMAGLLSAYGYKLTQNKFEADLWLLNSCTVKSPAEDHFRNEITAARKAGKCVVVAGCVSQGAPKSEFLSGLSIIGVQQIDRVVEVVEESLKGNSVKLLSQKKSGGKKLGGASLSLPKVRRNPLIEIIPINTGCLNQCTYCKTKHARGDLGSYPPEEIIARAVESFNEGVVELWLTSEDTGAYGRDIGTNLPELLQKLVPNIPEGCMLRIGMTNPPYILDHLQEMATILNHDRVYSFLHIPVQSGSDSVLTEMKREYCRAEFEKVVNVLFARVPEMTIATDIICGFPTETEEDFQETLDLCGKYKFPSLFINQFFPRPGTPAARMPRVNTQEVKRRTKRLTELFHSYEPYGHLVGRKFKVLVTEEAHDKQHYVGHNKSYQQVLVPNDPKLMGKQVEVEIISATKYSMEGRVIDYEEVSIVYKTAHQKTKLISVLFALILALLFARFLWIFI